MSTLKYIWGVCVSVCWGGGMPTKTNPTLRGTTVKHKAVYADISKITLTDSKLRDLEDLVKTVEVVERILLRALRYLQQ